ncbi:zinc ABC transporter substrate-binding protein [bacterium]|nr:zinc ABC transporter substrate-binding protein [bacterium]
MQPSLNIIRQRPLFLMMMLVAALVLAACPAKQDQQTTPGDASGSTASTAGESASAEVTADQPGAGDGTAPQFVASIAPLGMILSELCAGRAEVSVLLPPGASPHTYEPLPSDLRAVEQARAFFYIADVLDGWAAELGTGNTFAVGALVPDELRLELTAHDHHTHAHDGHGHEESGHAPPDHEHGAPGHDHEAHEPAHDHAAGESMFDPHFWTSPRTVQAVLPQLAAELARLDPAGQAVYEANAARFVDELAALDTELAAQLDPLAGRQLLLFHPSIMYFMRDYRLELAAVIEPAPGKEPSARMIADLMNLARQLKLTAVFSEPQLPRGPAETIAAEAGLALFELDPLGGVADRETYAELLRYNAGVLTEALAARPAE